LSCAATLCNSSSIIVKGLPFRKHVIQQCWDRHLYTLEAEGYTNNEFLCTLHHFRTNDSWRNTSHSLCNSRKNTGTLLNFSQNRQRTVALMMAAGQIAILEIQARDECIADLDETAWPNRVMDVTHTCLPKHIGDPVLSVSCLTVTPRKEANNSN